MKVSVVMGACLMACAVATGASARDASFAVSSQRVAAPGQYDALLARHAAANGLPVELLRRLMMKESGGRAHVVSAGNYGLMQIRHGTARGLGYTGSAAGLLDPETNMTYAARYLAGAYRAAGGNHERAIAYYQRGYYHAAKRMGQTQMASAPVAPVFTLASAPLMSDPTPPHEHRAKRRTVATTTTGMASPDFTVPVQAVPKGRQKAMPGLLDRLSAALAPDEKGQRKSRRDSTWTKRLLSQEAEARRVERLRAANRGAQ